MEKIRLSKLMSQRGLCSRREADAYIERGWVFVDGAPVTALGTKVSPNQQVTLDPRARRAQRAAVTVLLNKPVGYVSAQPEKGYPAAASLITRANHSVSDPDQRMPALKGLAAAGRLDIDSQGLLVFTQDGRIAKKLIGADGAVEKEYLVRVEGGLSAQGLMRLNHGLSLDGRALKPATVTRLNPHQLRFVLREGRKRQIRRMCELVGLRVTGLKRVRIGRVVLGGLPEGQWRLLGPQEEF